MAKRILPATAVLAGALLLAAPGAPAQAAGIKKEMKFAVELAEKGLWNEAAHRFLNLLKRAPHNPRLWNDLAVAYEAMGRYEDAREAYDKAMKLMANPPEAIAANYEAFDAFYRTWQDPSTVQPPPVSDPRSAEAARPTGSPPPAFPGPEFDDAEAEGTGSGEAEAPPPAPRDPLRPVFPDEKAPADDGADAPADTGAVEEQDAPPPDDDPGAGGDPPA